MSPVAPARTLIQLVPPGLGGVRDHAQCLHDEWLHLGVASHLFDLSKAGAAARSLSDTITGAFPLARRPCSLLVHFSGYGYGERGICFWLLRELQAAQRRFGAALRVVVLFHETYANGPPWRSAFWLSPAQALIAVRLARLADALATNTDHHADWLRSMASRHTDLLVRPVFSNVGEGDGRPPATQRLPQAVVFGLASTRQRALDGLRDHRTALHGLGIESLVEVGSGTTTHNASIGLPIRSLGRLEVPALGALLRNSRFGVLSHPSHSLGKSGVFAAYASHGCVPIDTCIPGVDADGLVAGRDYLSLPAIDAESGSAAALGAVSARVGQWYAAHSVARQARDFMALLTGDRSTGVAAPGPAFDLHSG